jgi:hypothetical protein
VGSASQPECASGKRVTSEPRGLLVPTHVVATEVLQTGRETVDSEPIDPDEVDWRDVLDGGGTEEPASADMRHRVFQRLEDDSEDDLRAAIKAFGNVTLLASAAKVGRQAIYDFLAGGTLQPKTRKKIESALLKIIGARGVGHNRQ